MSESNATWLSSIRLSSIVFLGIGVLLGFGAIYLYFLGEADSRLSTMEKLLAAAAERSSEVDRATLDSKARVAQLEQQIADLSTQLASIDKDKLASLLAALKRMDGSPQISLDVNERLAAMETRLTELGSIRSGITFSVTNPRMGASIAQCPSGSFVSAVSAPRGVGGRYAVDGISQITVTCTPLHQSSR